MRINKADQAVLDHVSARDAAIVSRAVAWANVNSGSRNRPGLDAVLDLIEGAARALPAVIERIPTVPVTVVADDGAVSTVQGADALRIRARPEAPVQVVLTGHHDTVYPADSPFQAVTTRPDGALRGPGIADMKGGLSVMLAALEAFETHPERDRVGWTVLISPDEETGSHGSAPLLAELGVRGHLGLTYEPSMPDGALAAARKGSGNWKLAVTGRAAHAGRAFHEGVNAVAGAAILASALHALNGQRDGVTVNVAQITGGGPPNVVPDRALVSFNARVPDAASARWVEDALARITAAPPLDGLGLALHGGFTRPPKPMDAAQTALFEAARTAAALIGQPLHWRDTGGVCEGNNLHAAGLPNIDTLGVIGGDIHSDREYAWPHSFAERARLSALILCKVASGEIDALALKRLRTEAA